MVVAPLPNKKIKTPRTEETTPPVRTSGTTAQHSRDPTHPKESGAQEQTVQEEVPAPAIQETRDNVPPREASLRARGPAHYGSRIF